MDPQGPLRQPAQRVPAEEESETMDPQAPLRQTARRVPAVAGTTSRRMYNEDIPEQIRVTEAGVAAVNGTYEREGVSEDAFKYVKDGRMQKITIFKCKKPTTTINRWFIAIVADEENPGRSTDDITFYRITDDIGDPFPPWRGWRPEAPVGRNPEPLLEYVYSDGTTSWGPPS